MAILPLKMFKRRTQIGTCLEAFFVMLCLLLGAYYLPLFYQAKGHTATHSGIDILPFMLSVVIGAGVSGGIINFTGRYWYFLFFGPFLSSIGCGLLYTITSTTPTPTLIGYQILFGTGVGCALQNTIIAIQAEYADDERLIPQGTSMVNFTQLVGGIIGIAIAGTIFANQLQTQLAFFAPTLDPATAYSVRQSVTVIFTLPLEQQEPVIKAYCRALGHVFILGIPCGVLGSLSAL
jgi:MFS family permease